MKKLIYTLLIGALALSACHNTPAADPKQEEKDLQGKVIDFHEKVMADDEKAMVNVMSLDTLIMKAKQAKADTAELHKYKATLTAADNAMGDWMKGFDPDYTGKSHDDIMKYLAMQQVKVKQVDSLLMDATKQTSAYLQSIKKK